MTPPPIPILLAEDEADARELLARGLGRAGFAVTACADGQEALAALNSFNPAAVITDLLMPRLDGIGLLHELHRRGVDCIRVVVTAFADKEGTIAALNAGADHLIEKPFAASQLAELLHRLLADRTETSSHHVTALYERRLADLALGESDRQLVTLVLKGAANRRIADLLGIQEQSVKNRLLELYRRLGVASRTELVHLIFPV